MKKNLYYPTTKNDLGLPEITDDNQKIEEGRYFYSFRKKSFYERFLNFFKKNKGLKWNSNKNDWDTITLLKTKRYFLKEFFCKIGLHKWEELNPLWMIQKNIDGKRCKWCGLFIR